MSISLNRVTLVGNLGRDPDCRSTQSGDRVTNLSIATSESWKDRNTGERREKTEWHRVVLWRGLADIAEKFLSKGDRVYIEGQLQTRKWQDQSGQDRYSTEVVCSGFTGKLIMMGDSGGGRGDGSGYNDRRDDDRDSGGPSDTDLDGFAGPDDGADPGLDDEIPF